MCYLCTRYYAQCKLVFTLQHIVQQADRAAQIYQVAVKLHII